MIQPSRTDEIDGEQTAEDGGYSGHRYDHAAEDRVAPESTKSRHPLLRAESQINPDRRPKR